MLLFYHISNSSKFAKVLKYAREGVFDASIDRVRKLVQDHIKEGLKIHPSAKNVVTKMLDENTFINSWNDEINGQSSLIKAKGTMFYPVGDAFEMIEGPFADSAYMLYTEAR